MSNFDGTCPSCGKPIKSKDGKVPKHTVNVLRLGMVIQAKCPGVGKTPR